MKIKYQCRLIIQFWKRDKGAREPHTGSRSDLISPNVKCCWPCTSLTQRKELDCSAGSNKVMKRGDRDAEKERQRRNFITLYQVYYHTRRKMLTVLKTLKTEANPSGICFKTPPVVLFKISLSHLNCPSKENVALCIKWFMQNIYKRKTF